MALFFSEPVAYTMNNDEVGVNTPVRGLYLAVSSLKATGTEEVFSM